MMGLLTKLDAHDEVLECNLSTKEQLEAGVELVKAFEEMDAVDNAAKTAAAEHKAAAKAIAERIAALLPQVKMGVMSRTVAVEVWANHDTLKVRSIRQDTKQVIHERTMTAAERQLPIDLVTEPEKDKPKKPRRATSGEADAPPPA